MKNVFLMIVLLALPAVAHADDFGERFHSEAPQALGESEDVFTTDALEQVAQEEFRPELIEPAAGDEDKSQHISAESEKENQPNEN